MDTFWLVLLGFVCFLIVLGVVGVLLPFWNAEAQLRYVTRPQAAERELSSSPVSNDSSMSSAPLQASNMPINLCDSHTGLLNDDAVGFARSIASVITCNLFQPVFRRKRWNSWSVADGSVFFGITIVDLDYAGLLQFVLWDRVSNEFISRSFTRICGLKGEMPENTDDNLAYETSGVSVSLTHTGATEFGADFVNIACSVADFAARKRALNVQLQVRYPHDMQGLNVVIPWTPERFQFLAKHLLLPTSGVVAYQSPAGEMRILDVGLKTGDSRTQLPDSDPDPTHTHDAQCFHVEWPQSPAWAVFDFGRGVPPYRTRWNWGCCNGTVHPQDSDLVVAFAVNLGGGWMDNTGMTENAVWVNGVMFKMSQTVEWHYDFSNMMAAWHISSDPLRIPPDAVKVVVDLTFTPQKLHVDSSNALIISSCTTKLWGTFSGHVTVESKTFILSNLFGWAEDHFSRW